MRENVRRREPYPSRGASSRAPSSYPSATSSSSRLHDHGGTSSLSPSSRDVLCPCVLPRDASSHAPYGAYACGGASSPSSCALSRRPTSDCDSYGILWHLTHLCDVHDDASCAPDHVYGASCGGAPCACELRKSDRSHAARSRTHACSSCGHPWGHDSPLLLVMLVVFGVMVV